MNSVIDEISKRSREEILSKVSNGYKIPCHVKTETQNPVVHIKVKENLIENLVENMTANKFVVHDIDKSKLIDTINEIAKNHNANTLLYPSDLGIDVSKVNATERRVFDKQIEEMRYDVFHTDFSIINVFKGVASHGVACVVSSEHQPRMLSLSMPLCIMLLKKEDVVKSLVDALDAVKSKNEILPTNILFIAGPSRTSDIELITVFGVHGSQSVHLILY